MCMTEIRIYPMRDGTEHRVERVQRCQQYRQGLPCDDLSTIEGRVQILEVKPSGSARSSRSSSYDTIQMQDRHGRDQEYRRISRREGKRPARDRDDRLPYPASPISPRAMRTEEVRPAAPSPPRPAGNHYHPLNPRCPRDDCPMTPGSFDVEERSPLPSIKHKHDSKEGASSSKRVTIEIPRNNQQTVPILQQPRPGKKADKPHHSRHDSGVGLPSNRNADRVVDADALRADLEQQRRRLAQSEDQRLRAEAREEAYQAQLDLDRAHARESARNDSRERQRRVQLAEAAALEAARKVRDAEAADAAHERRVRGEERDRERERRAHRRLSSVEMQSALQLAPATTSPMSPRVHRTAIVHQARPGPVTSQQQSFGNDIIRREQDRLEREQIGRSAMDDPLSDDPWRSNDVVREWASSGEGPRRGHRGQYNGTERR